MYFLVGGVCLSLSLLLSSLSLSLTSSPGHEGSAKPLGLVAPPDVRGAFGGVSLSLSIFLFLSVSLLLSSLVSCNRGCGAAGVLALFMF